MEALMGVRRRLEAGRGWREIRAGEGFTRKLMGSLEEKPRRGGGVALTSWIVGLAMVAVVGVGVWGLVGLMGWGGLGAEGRGGGGQVRGGEAGAVGTGAMGGTGAVVGGQELGQGRGGVISYSSPVVAWDFGGAWPEETRVWGGLEMESGARGWGPKVGGGVNGGGSAAWLEAGLGKGKGSVVEVTMEVPGVVAGGGGGGGGMERVAVQVFVTTAGELDGQMGTSGAGKEWAWQVDGAGMKVATGTGEVLAVGSGREVAGMVVVVLEVGAGDEATVSVAGERVWSGRLGIGDGERRVGVRFLARGEVRGVPLRVMSLRVFEGR